MAARRKLRLQEKRRRMRIFLSALGGVLVIGLLVGSVALLRLPEVNIASVSIEGANYTRDDLVLQMVEGMLAGNYLLVIPRTNTFIYPKSAIERDLHSLFPAVKKASFSRVGFTGLSVSLEERIPDAWWCPSSGTSSPCYLMDEQGFLFTQTTPEEETRVVYYGSISGEPIAQTYLGGMYPRLASFVQNLSIATERKPVDVRVDENYDAYITFEEGGELRFTLENTNDALLDNIASVFASRRFSSDSEILEYADFRFGNKIFVKFVGDE